MTLGLEGVVAAETSLSRVDGVAGELIIAGQRVGHHIGGFDALAARLIPSIDLGAGRAAAWKHRIDRQLPLGMDTVRAQVASLPESPPAAIAGAVSVAAAAWFRLRQGLDPIPPNPGLSHSEDWLTMCGLAHEASRCKAFDEYLCTVVDHGLNASTFAARVVASTQSDDVSAVVAAIGALKGPLHGGAPGPVLDMLDAIATPAGAEPWLLAELDAGRRIMGMGHRVYRVRDPRAAVLESAAAALGAHSGIERKLELAKHVETTAARLLGERKPGRAIRANVEFATAVLLDAIGLDRSLFTLAFATSRVIGWLAHADEQRRHGRLIRPSCRYVGPVI